MRHFLALSLYRLALPLLFLAAFPGWVLKMVRRGGFGTGLPQRIAIYGKAPHPTHAIHFHAVSVGESLLALKLIRQWLTTSPQQKFILATGTATGHAVATAAHIPQLQVIYAPLDFRWMIRRYLRKFQPQQIVLIEGEVWPHLLLSCRKQAIPVRLVNARISPRSTRRFRKFASWLRPIYSLLDAVAIQQPADAEIWETLGVSPEKIHLTGSAKFDPTSGQPPTPRPEFQKILDALGPARPVILAVSTHPGEELLIAQAIQAAGKDLQTLIAPRHAERRAEIRTTLEAAHFTVQLRSAGTPSASNSTSNVLLIDSTGELRDWTAHATLVIIGKSFLSTGGQNPCEAIIARKPVIFGPHMGNFQPLASQLIATGGCITATDQATLTQAIHTALDPENARSMTHAADVVLAEHGGATRRILQLLGAENQR